MIHAPIIFVRGTIFTGGGGGGSFADRCEATGAIGPGGACACANPASNNPIPLRTKTFSNSFITSFLKGAHLAEPHRIHSFRRAAKFPGCVRPLSHSFQQPS